MRVQVDDSGVPGRLPEGRLQVRHDPFQDRAGERVVEVDDQRVRREREVRGVLDAELDPRRIDPVRPVPGDVPPRHGDAGRRHVHPDEPPEGIRGGDQSGLPLPQPRSMKTEREKSAPRPSSASLMAASLVVS